MNVYNNIFYKEGLPPKEIGQMLAYGSEDEEVSNQLAFARLKT